MTRDMTQGSPLKLLLSFMVPIFIGNLFQNLYSIVDSIIVGRYLGVNALAAVGSVGIVVFGVQGLAIGMTSGFGVIFSQKFGKKQESSLRHFIAVSAYVAMAFSLIVTVILLVAVKPLLRIMNTPADIYADTYTYTYLFFVGFTATVAYNFFAATARAIGDSKTPLYFLIFSAFLNVVLDIVMIRDFHMGVAGAAIATVLSQMISAVLSGFYLINRYPILRVQKEEARFSMRSALQLLGIGVPMALQFFITSFGGIVLQSALNQLGAAAIAANSGAQKIGQVIQQVGVAMGTALATFVGQNAGAEEKQRIRLGVRQAAIFTAAVFGVLMIFCRLFGKYAGLLFLSEANEEVQSLMGVYFDVVTWAFIPLGLIFIYRNALQGLGDGFFPMLGGAFELFGRIAVAVFIGTKMGFAGICLADVVAWVAALIPLVPAYYIRISRFGEEKMGTSTHGDKL